MTTPGRGSLTPQVYVHDVDTSLYANLPVEETTYNGTRWKMITTGGIDLVFFPERTVPDADVEVGS